MIKIIRRALYATVVVLVLIVVLVVASNCSGQTPAPAQQAPVPSAKESVPAVTQRDLDAAMSKLEKLETALAAFEKKSAEQLETLNKRLQVLPAPAVPAIPAAPAPGSTGGQAVAVPKPAAPQIPASQPQPTSVCPDKAIRTEPQGVSQSDGSFVAQFGNTGCVTVFEGRIWEEGKGIQNRHDIVKIEGAKDGFRYWEGNGWLLPASWDAQQIACMLWDGKKKNWISQGINPLPVQFWNFPSGFSCP